MRWVVFPMLVATLALSGQGCVTESFDDTPAVKASVEGASRYEQLTNAVDDGYDVDMSERTSDYFVPGRGIEVPNPTQTTLDPNKPQSLVYEFATVKCYNYECPNQGYKLVAFRYTQPADGRPAPELFGQTFTGPVGNPPVWELYSWIKPNPNGKYAPTNPTVVAPSWWPELFQTWRTLATKYPTPDAAKAGGYSFMFAERPDGTLADCVYSRQQAFGQRGLGAMGYHWMVIPMISRDPASIKPTAPAGLLFFQKKNLKWIVGGLEWILWAAQQRTPNLYGYIFDGPMKGHQATQPEHFDLHVYPGYLNPDGVMTTWNRAAQCPLTP